MIPGHDWISSDTDCAGPFSFGGGRISPLDSSRMGHDHFLPQNSGLVSQSRDRPKAYHVLLNSAPRFFKAALAPLISRMGPRQEVGVVRKSGLALAIWLPLALAFSGDAQRDALAAQAGAAQGGEQNGKLEQVIPGYYVYSNGARISGIIATNEGVVVIDALSNEAMAKHERQLIAETIKQPIKYLISPTFHGNYSRGNVAYPEAIKIGHEYYKADLIEQMKSDNTPANQQAAMLPHLTFRDRMPVTVSGKELHI